MWDRDTKVLVADDNQDAADTLAMLLELEGCTVRTEHDGAAALSAFMAEHPSVLCLDIGMPQLNGLELARRIRDAEPEGEHALMIAISGWGTARDRAKSAAAGFDHHMVKPADFERLKRWIDAFVGHHTYEGSKPDLEELPAK